MTLLDKQQQFAQLVATLLLKAHELGYGVTLGEAYRTPEQAAWNAAHGRGIRQSVHMNRLAIDLNLFEGRRYLSASDAYRPLGEWWEQQSREGFTCCWGGRFTRPDGNHFSVAHGGRR